MKRLKIIVLSTALSVASHAHSQAQSAGLLGGLLPQITGIASQTVLPVVNGLIGDNELIGGIAAQVSDTLNTTLNTVLPFPVQALDVVIPLIDELTSDGEALQLGGQVPMLLDITNSAVIPLLGGPTKGEVF
jgi:hypothetical protein